MAQASELCKVFFTTINKVYHILREESFSEELATYSRDPESADLGWLALLCAVLSQGMLLQQASTAWKPTSTSFSGRDEAEKLLETAQSCIAQTAFTARPTIAAIQCLCITAVSRQLAPFSCYDTDSAWVLTGLILKLAYSLRLHDSKRIPDLSESEREKREMLWHAIVHLELRQSLTAGKPTMLRLRDLASLQRVDSGFSNAAWVSALPVVAEILDEKHSAEPTALSRQSIAQYDYELRRLLRRADESDVASTTVGIQHHQHIALTIFIRRTRLALHYPESSEPDAFLHYPEGYWASLECCLGLLALQRTLDECCQPSGCSWLAELFKEDFYTAALTLCQYLLQDVTRMGLAAPPLHADTGSSSGLQNHPKETVMETLRSCRDIWDRKKGLSFCQSMAYKVFNAVLKKIEEAETTGPTQGS
ncbi:uncharacterized protein HMPREF1541_11082 [Cyphellophora europaea CBS 101466]|uniref:Xylanolytic transcriptional activator regulatory domain-containing protein n=1 Tax=Cyphellophora europaea (strain CBS 101466) TaxID=1220924 RepID=W2S5H5_CYPE1|nr:uncharacterized protein HMPREF1541_11082 [Cyphellophora europaea CBS 101466]ETN43951.1 hypothetical protein HMPREF1541_11082 [Cyphellophora europaea CBS 101466]